MLEDDFQKKVREKAMKLYGELAEEALTRGTVSTASTATSAVPGEALTSEKIKAAIDSIQPVPVRPFNEIWCNTPSLKQAVEDTGGVWKKGLSPIGSLIGIPVVLHEELPNMLMLIKQPDNPFELPKIYGIVNIDVKEV